MIETGFFAKGDPLENINQPARFVDVAFELNDDEVSEPLELGDKYYVMQVLERQAASVPELSAVEGKVRAAVMEKKKDEIAKKNAEAFLAGVAGGKGFTEEAKASGLEVKNSGFFKRVAPITGIGFEQGLSDAAFSLTPSRPLPENPIEGKKGYYVIILKEEKAADAKGFEDKKLELKSELLAQKQQKLLEDWLSQLRQRAEVLIEEGILD
jgi:peptidyl-prolyl cis-trans isomerase D